MRPGQGTVDHSGVISRDIDGPGGRVAPTPGPRAAAPRRFEVLVHPGGLEVLEVDGGFSTLSGEAPPAVGPCAGALAGALSSLGVRCRVRFRSPCG
ncbi:MAG: hypothetical protein K6T75_01245 [Acetobacteraceae bacterium]|nr:hypothetical protein [Acetobacteraceae bacterium]